MSYSELEESHVSNANAATPATESPKASNRGRPRGTPADAVPVTLHLSAEVVKRSRISLLQKDDKRPLSALVNTLLERWSQGLIVL